MVQYPRGDDMIEEIFTKEKLLERAKELSKKRFSPGFDGMTMDGAYSWIFINRDNLSALSICNFGNENFSENYIL